MTDLAEKPFHALLVRQRVKMLTQVVQATILSGLVIYCAWEVGLIDLRRMSDGVPAIAHLLGEMFPPDFTRAEAWIGPLVDTLAMSVAGTALAVVLSLPLAFLAAPNTSPNKVIYYFARGILNFWRSIPELILGIIFVAAVGFGALPGVLALGLHSVGMVGKFFAEAVEHVDPRPLEAARAAGATEVQVIWHAILPQVLPQFIDITIYRWEYNFRASTVMGMVGAGGIGAELIGALRILQYQEVCALLISVLAMVTIVDGFGAFLRKRLR